MKGKGGKDGSPSRGNIRTTLRFLATLLVDSGSRPEANERRHHFAWEEAPVWNVRAAKRRPKRRNPVHLAREWRAVMDAHGESRADLARRLGVSRARVTQVLQILDLDPLVLAYVDRHSGGGISERVLRRLRGLSPAEQRKCIADLAVPV